MELNGEEDATRIWSVMHVIVKLKLDGAAEDQKTIVQTEMIATIGNLLNVKVFQ